MRAQARIYRLVAIDAHGAFHMDKGFAISPKKSIDSGDVEMRMVIIGREFKHARGTGQGQIQQFLFAQGNAEIPEHVLVRRDYAFFQAHKLLYGRKRSPACPWAGRGRK